MRGQVNQVRRLSITPLPSVIFLIEYVGIQPHIQSGAAVNFVENSTVHVVHTLGHTSGPPDYRSIRPSRSTIASGGKT